MADELDDQLDYELDVGTPQSVDIAAEDIEEHFSDIDSGPNEVPSKKPRTNAKSDSSRIQAGPKASKRGKVSKDANGSKKAVLAAKKQLRMQQQAAQKTTLGVQGPAATADFVVGKLQREYSDLSALELQDRAIPESSIVDTSGFTSERTLATLPQFFSVFSLDKAPEGSKKLVLVLCISAVRVCDVARALRRVGPGGSLKLIAKNKLEYDRHALASPAFVAVSTPGRTRKLSSDGTLDLDRVSAIIMDSAFLDQKQNHVWDLPETLPLVSELSKQGRKVYIF